MSKRYKILDLDGKHLLSFRDKRHQKLETGEFLEGTISKIYCYQNFFVKTWAYFNIRKSTNKRSEYSYQTFTYKGHRISHEYLKWVEDKELIDHYNNVADEVDEEAYDRANWDC